MSNCSNACGHTCNTLTCRSCNEPSICTPGCVCPSPLVMNTLGECIEINQCLCQTSDGKINLLHGQTMNDPIKCEDWLDLQSHIGKILFLFFNLVCVRMDALIVVRLQKIVLHVCGVNGVHLVFVQRNAMAHKHDIVHVHVLA